MNPATRRLLTVSKSFESWTARRGWGEYAADRWSRYLPRLDDWEICDTDGLLEQWTELDSEILAAIDAGADVDELLAQQRAELVECSGRRRSLAGVA